MAAYWDWIWLRHCRIWRSVHFVQREYITAVVGRSQLQIGWMIYIPPPQQISNPRRSERFQKHYRCRFASLIKLVSHKSVTTRKRIHLSALSKSKYTCPLYMLRSCWTFYQRIHAKYGPDKNLSSSIALLKPFPASRCRMYKLIQMASGSTLNTVRLGARCSLVQ